MMNSSSLILSPGNLKAGYQRLLVQATKARAAERIMRREAALFSRSPKLRSLIGNRLGWVDVASTMQERINQITAVADRAIADGLTDVVLLGMGGSSLCPEVFSKMFSSTRRVRSFHVLDTTDPEAILRVMEQIDLRKGLFIVASKSGGTIETRSQEAYIHAQLRHLGNDSPGTQCIAITDPGSDLEQFARTNRYREIFQNPADIGGRYSALSYFGLLPGYLAGVDLTALLADAVIMQRLLAERVDETNPAVALGALMAAGVLQKKDKLTFLASPRIAPFVPWVEQLIAESTGKEKTGVVPIEAEEIAAAEFGPDRIAVLLAVAGEAESVHRRMARSLEKKRIATANLSLGTPYSIGGQFVLWELATAICGYLLGINPFDEPNVTESKNNTRALLDAVKRGDATLTPQPLTTWGALSLIAVSSPKEKGIRQSPTLTKGLHTFLAGARSPQYCSVLAYTGMDDETESAITQLRNAIRKKTGLATLRGYGPRFLHSIGQLYKGGPQTGRFIILVRAQSADLPIPNQAFGFGQLIAAQALGDAQALISRKLPTLVLAISGDPAEAIRSLAAAMKRRG